MKLSSALDYEAMLLGTPSLGYFGQVVAFMLLLFFYILFVSGLKYYVRVNVLSEGTYNYQDSLTELLTKPTSPQVVKI